MRTDHFIRFERVDSVEETTRGLLARVHGERCASTRCAPTSCASS